MDLKHDLDSKRVNELEIVLLGSSYESPVVFLS